MDNKSQLADRFRVLSEPLVPHETDAKTVLKKLPGIKAVIFDFYGTLFISGVGDIGIDDGISDATLIVDALKGAGISVIKQQAGERCLKLYNEAVEHEVQEIRERGIPYPEPDIRKIWSIVLSRLHAENLITTDTDSNHHNLMAVEFEARMNPIWPMPDLHQILKRLKDKQLKLGIISNSQFYTPIAFEALAEKSLDEFGFSSELLHWSFDVAMKKPGLLFYEQFLSKAEKAFPQLKPENYLYVGNDMLKDIYPANHFGMKTALFAGDQRSLKWHRKDSRTKNLKPDLVITELIQLLNCL